MKKAAFLLGATILLLSALTPVLAFTPTANAASKYNWQITVSGKGILHPCITGYGCNLDFNVEGWCAFSGTSSGTSGDCSLNRSVHSPSGDLSCETRIDITAWHTGPALMGPPVTDFIIDSGTVMVSPPGAAATCSALILVAGGYHTVLSGTPGELTISASSDTHFPYAPGHYTVGSGPVTWSVFNLQITENPS